MKKLIFIFSLLSVGLSHAQIKLYTSEQTGQMTFLSDTDYVTTDWNESGDCSCTSSGPLIFSVTPTSVGTNQLTPLTIIGILHPDGIPPAGTTAYGSISCSCTWNWKEPDPLAPFDEDPPMVDKSDKADGVMDVEIVSLKITASAQVCDCGVWQLQSIPYPAGNVTWYLGDQSIGTGASMELPYDPTKEGSSVFAKLDVEGITYSSNNVTLAVWGGTVKSSYTTSSNTTSITIETEQLELTDCDIKWSGPGTQNCTGLTCVITKDENVPADQDKVTFTYDNGCGKKGSLEFKDVHLATILDVTGPAEIRVANMEYINWRDRFTVVWSAGRKPVPLPMPSFSDNIYNPLGSHGTWVCRVGATVEITIGGQLFKRSVLIHNTDPHCPGN